LLRFHIVRNKVSGHGATSNSMRPEP
jgi:hypothetical protein